MKEFLFKTILFIGISIFYSPNSWSQDYPVSFPADQAVTHASRRLNAISLNGITITIDDNSKVYNTMLDHTFIVEPGQSVTPDFSYNGVWMNGYVYIDFGHDGQYDVTALNEDGTIASPNDLVSYSYYKGKNSAGTTFDNGNHITMPSFTIPENMEPGYYRMRFKLDWNNIDPAGSTVSGNEIVKNGGAIADVRLLVQSGDAKVIVNSKSSHGQIVFHTGASFNSTKRSYGEELPIMAYPEEGYKLTGLRVRHGNLSADSLIHGLPQYVDSWFDASQFSHGLFSVPASCIENEVMLEGIFQPLADGEQAETEAWALTFYDEFNFSDGSQPNSTKWSRCPRKSATWSRFISDSEDVVFIQDGNLVCRAIPDPDRAEGSTDMLTGAIQSKGKYACKYGRIEARLKSVRHTGNFPAFWMMPENNTGGWPTCGEIDIFETIDSQNRAWHTVHSNWTHNLGKTGNPPSSANESVSVGDWHVYGLEWEATEIRWYLDGRLVHSYAKSSSQDDLDKGQWPFDKEFYLILNQSVGNGSWAAKNDGDFTYETRFDWVRVYQLKEANTIPTGIDTPIGKSLETSVFDLSGRRLASNVSARKTFRPGLYIINGKKTVIQ